VQDPYSQINGSTSAKFAFQAAISRFNDNRKHLISIKNPRSKLRGIGGRKEADQKNAASCGEYVPKEI
jgi:hypothetical protein